MRIALGLEYCGAPFSGWQTQRSGNTVQDHLEFALSSIAGAPISVVAAGRTDTGVHATGQVVHFDTDADRPLSAWIRGTNSALPDGITVRWAMPVAEEFHARFSATHRRYRYFLLNRPTRPAILAGRIGWDYHPLDVTKMADGASHLLGQHDFSSFRAAECQARSPVRTLQRAEVRRIGEFIVFDFAADAFLHHMVRNLVGMLVYVGQGREPVSRVGELLALRDRRTAPPTFMAAGLYLVEVGYPAHFALPAVESGIFPWEPA